MIKLGKKKVIKKDQRQICVEDQRRICGFTLVEILVIIGIMLILMGLAIPSYRFFQKESDLTNSAEEIISTLRLAQNKTLASEGASQFGVYFNQSTTPHQYTLFKGENYGVRDESFDKIHKLSSFLEISEINLVGGASEVVFDRVFGTTLQSGYLSIRLRDSPAKTKSIYIENFGRIELGSSTPPSDTERIKDSRHVHFTYSQNAKDAITLHLVFPDYPADNFDIAFQTYLNLGKTEFYWEGKVLVGPSGNKTEQNLIIQTHSLELTYAQFSVHRDRRYNDKALEITLDDQNLINYTVQGNTAKGSSIHVSEPEWQ